VTGSSGSPLATKLGIRPGAVVAVLHIPDRLVLGLPDGVTGKHRATRRADVVVDFVTRGRGLVDNKVCAIDDSWTGLRVVWRVGNR
jgi:hypothetical protein